jgi:hypothetical protein
VGSSHETYADSYRIYSVYKHYGLYYIQNIIHPLTMKSITFGIVVLLVVTLSITCYAETTTKNSNLRRCRKPNNGQHICFCGKNLMFDRLKGEQCINGQVIRTK